MALIGVKTLLSSHRVSRKAVKIRIVSMETNSPLRNCPEISPEIRVTTNRLPRAPSKN